MHVSKVPGKGFSARVGDFFGPVREDSQKAIKALDEALETFHPLNHVYVRCGDGTVLHLFQIPSHGWNIAIIPPAGYQGKGIGTQATYGEAEARARAWAVKNADGVEHVG